MKDNEDFFKSQTASSLIKSNIVAEYFPKYCKIILKSPQEEIWYMDLFAGPGIYDDGSLSTPMLLAQHIASDIQLKSKVRLFFNDNKYSDMLRKNFQSYFPEGTFDLEPRFAKKTVGEDKDIYNFLSKEPTKKNKKPTLLFFDPFGYKDINTKILANFLENWGNELFLFINIKRIHAAIQNGKFEQLMRALFSNSFDQLKEDRRYTSSVLQRLSLIMDNIAQEFQSYSTKKLYHTAFRFQEEDSNATSHYIIHFTKHAKGFELAKQIYHDYDNVGSTLTKSGDYSFDAKLMYSTVDTQQLLFSDLNKINLAADLQSRFAGQQISARELFDIHHIDSKYCGTHYAKALRYLEENNKIIAKFTDNVNHRVSVLLTHDCILNFI